MYTNIEYNTVVVQSPCFLLFPFFIPFWSPFVSLYLLGTLLAVIGSCPPRSQVACKLISPFPYPSPYTPLSKIPTPWGLPELNMHITKTTSRTWLTRSSTGTVRRDLTGVENRLKRSVLIKCKTALLYYLILKGHHHKRRKTSFSVLTSFYIEADWTLSIYSAKDVPVHST
jgi:hypothetical protein